MKKNSRKERFVVEYEDPDRAEEDDFRLGISVTKKGLKLFTPFAAWDIIVTSLVGLRLAISASEEKKEKDFSFLSSVEVLVIDRAHALYM